MLQCDVSTDSTAAYKQTEGRLSTDCDNQIQAFEFTNEEGSQEILRLNEEINDLITNKQVTRCGCFDNVLCFIKKKSVQAAGKHKRWLRLHYPNMEVADECDDPNAIH